MPGNELLLRSRVLLGALFWRVSYASIAFLIYFRYHGSGWLAEKLEQPKWRTGWREKIAVLLEGFSDGLRGVRTWGDLGALAGYTAVHWVLVVFVYLWVRMRSEVSWPALVLRGPLWCWRSPWWARRRSFLAACGGSQVATFLVFTLIFGVEKEPAAIATIVLWLITFMGCAWWVAIAVPGGMVNGRIAADGACRGASRRG